MYKTKEEMNKTELLYFRIYGTTSGYYDKKTGKTYYRV